MLKKHLKIAFRNFTYDFIYGDTNTALGMPNSIVLSEPLAHNFFGKDNPVEKSIVVIHLLVNLIIQLKVFSEPAGINLTSPLFSSLHHWHGGL